MMFDYPCTNAITHLKFSSFSSFVLFVCFVIVVVGAPGGGGTCFLTDVCHVLGLCQQNTKLDGIRLLCRLPRFDEKQVMARLQAQLQGAAAAADTPAALQVIELMSHPLLCVAAYPRSKVQALCAVFQANHDVDGLMREEVFSTFLQQVFGATSEYCSAYFHAFDSHARNAIDVMDFVLGLAAMDPQTPNTPERLPYVYRMYADPISGNLIFAQFLHMVSIC